MTRRNQTDTSDKLCQEGVWNQLTTEPTGQTSSPRARLAPCRAFMAKSTDYLQVLIRFSEPKGTRWCDSLKEREVGDHVLLQPGNKAEKLQWKKPVAGLGLSVSSSRG